MMATEGLEYVRERVFQLLSACQHLTNLQQRSQLLLFRCILFILSDEL